MRKIMKTPSYFFVALFTLLFVTSAAAQDEVAETEAIILHNDSLFWNAYNNCDTDKFSSFFSDDIEFYHDKGGVTTGNKEFSETFRKNLCSNPDFRLRREAVDGTVKVYPMFKDNKIYGAIISGEHVFYITEKGKPEYIDGRANFTHLWILKDGAWKMTRVLSYNHHPAMSNNEKTVVPLSHDKLEQYVGTYKAPEAGLITVQRENDVLILKVSEKSFTLYPYAENMFFVKERDLTFEFIKAADNKPSKLIVREKGNIVEQADFEK